MLQGILLPVEGRHALEMEATSILLRYLPELGEFQSRGLNVSLIAQSMLVQFETLAARSLFT